MKTDTLPTILRSRMHKYGDRVALRKKDFGVWHEISWKDYYRNVKFFSLGMGKLGLKKGDRVCILSEGRPEWIFSDLAVQSAGAIRVGIYPTSPSTEVFYIADHSQATFFIAGDQEQTDKILDVKDKLPNLKKIIMIDMKGLLHYDDPLLIPFAEVQVLGEEADKEAPSIFEKMIDETEENSTALIVYTSGTTGPPKGAMMTHGNTIKMVHSLGKITDINDNDTLVSYLPLNHVAESLMSIFIPLNFGCTVNFAESVDTIPQDLYEIAPTVFLGVPRIWEKMLSSHYINMENSSAFKRWVWKISAPIGAKMVEKRFKRERVFLIDKILYWLAYIAILRAVRDRIGLLNVRFCFCGGASISTDVLKFFHSMGVQVREVYGMTETAGITTIWQGSDFKFGTVGTTVDGMEVKIAEDGEILMKGVGVFQGYYRDLKATESTLIDGWLHSGDVGHIDEDGHLVITDRIKDILITSGGKNISPSEIENRLKFSPYINEAIVIGDGRKFLSALIQIEYDSVADWAQNNKISYTTFKSLATNEDVRDLVANEVREANKTFAQVETIKTFTLLEKELDHDDGEITATKKVKRKIIAGMYKKEIDAMYKGKKKQAL